MLILSPCCSLNLSKTKLNFWEKPKPPRSRCYECGLSKFGLVMAGNGNVLSAWNCLPFGFTRALFHVDIVQDDRAKLSCTWVISHPVISPLPCRTWSGNCVWLFKEGPSWCLSTITSVLGVIRSVVWTHPSGLTGGHFESSQACYPLWAD